MHVMYESSATIVDEMIDCQHKTMFVAPGELSKSCMKDSKQPQVAPKSTGMYKYGLVWAHDWFTYFCLDWHSFAESMFQRLTLILLFKPELRL